MRIAVFIKATTFHRNYGGIETQNKALCEGLALRGYQIVVFTPQRELTITDRSENGVKYVFVPCDFGGSIFAQFNPNSWLKKSYLSMKKHHSDQRFDLILSQSSAGLGVIPKKREFFVPVISISHGTIIGELKTRLGSIRSLKSLLKLPLDIFYVFRSFFGGQRKFIYGSDKVIAVSNFVKESLINETFIDEKKIRVINNGVDVAPFEGLVRNYENKFPLKLMYLGKVLVSKGVFKLVDAVKGVNGVLLNIYGDGEDVESLKKYVKRKKLEEVVFVHGKVLYKDIISKYSSNDIFVFPSLRVEGFPMTLVEAMLAKLPIISTKVEGVLDAIKNGSTGVLVEIGNTKDLSDKIKFIRDSPETRKKLGETAYAKALENFSLNTMLNKYEAVFKEIIR